MIYYTVQRLLLAIPTLFGITLLAFLIMHLAPGDPVDLFLGGSAGGEGLSTNQRERIEQTRNDLRRQLGLDRPIYEQYAFWLSRVFVAVEWIENVTEYNGAGIVLYEGISMRIVVLDFGRSFKDQQPVIDHILKRLPITVEIGAISLVLSYLVGIPLGIVLASKQGSVIDRMLTAITFMLWSMPSFWIGMLFIMFLCNVEFLHWFPASGISSIEATEEWGFLRRLGDHAHHMVLPVVASSYASFAGVSRYLRTSMLENIRLDYVRTARAKGLAENLILLRHVLRNSLIPMVTLMAGLLPGLIAGSVFIETIFTIPGLGFLGFQSVIARDYPMVMAILTIGSALSLFGILLADVLLKAIDPRIDFARAQ